MRRGGTSPPPNLEPKMGIEKWEIESDMWADVSEEREEAFRDADSAKPIRMWFDGMAESPDGEGVRAWLLGERDPRD